MVRTRRGTATTGWPSIGAAVFPGKASYLGWTYIGPQVAGSTVVNGAIRGVNWPLAKGRYTAYLMKDDGYGVLAHADFRVREH